MDRCDSDRVGVWFSTTGRARYRDSYVIGDIGPAGGIVFYAKRSVTDGWRYLEAAPSDQSENIWWWNGSFIDISTGTAIGSGKANTDTIIAAQGSGTYAASLCKNLSLGGYSDWFLPSKDELELMYTNLCKAGLGGFEEYPYLSSSQFDTQKAWFYQFWDNFNYMDGYYKNSGFYVRAVRAF